MSTDVFYHGCYAEVGHFLWAPGGIRPTTEKSVHERMGFPLVEHPWVHSLDAGLCPGVTCERGYLRTPDEQPEGLGLIRHKDGWTAWAFWDRSVDNRGNSNSVFLAKGEHDFERMKELAVEHFPEVIERIAFEFCLAEIPQMTDRIDNLRDEWLRIADVSDTEDAGEGFEAGFRAALADTSTPKPCERCGETMKHLGTMLAFAEEVEYRETVLYGYDDQVNEVRAWFDGAKDTAALADTHDEQTGGE